MTKHQTTAVIILSEQVTGEWRPDSRGQGVEAKAKAKAKATIFCPRGVLEVEDRQSSRIPSLVCIYIPRSRPIIVRL